MLDLKLIPSFNGIKEHPSDDKIIKSLSITENQYKEKVNNLYKQNNKL
jgi:hypothetical protein